MAAAFTHEVVVMRERELRTLVRAAREFFKAFESMSFADLSTNHIQKLVDSHGLSISSLLTKYTKALRK